MSSNKNQHYLGKSIQRYFSENENKKSISGFIKDTGKYFQNARIRNQGSEDYLYENSMSDKIDTNIFQPLEDKVNTIFIRLVKHNNYSNFSIEERKIIDKFVIFQVIRTPFHRDNFNDFKCRLNELIKKVAEYTKCSICPQSEIDKLSSMQQLIIANDSPEMIMLHSNLNISILINQAPNAEFLLSDSAITLFNPIFFLIQVPKIYGLGHGIINFGYHCILNVSPRISVLFYEKSLYEYPSQLVFETDEQIFNVNKLILRGSIKKIYFSGKQYEKEMINNIIDHELYPNVFDFLKFSDIGLK